MFYLKSINNCVNYCNNSTGSVFSIHSVVINILYRAPNLNHIIFWSSWEIFG